RERQSGEPIEELLRFGRGDVVEDAGEVAGARGRAARDLTGQVHRDAQAAQAADDADGPAVPVVGHAFEHDHGSTGVHRGHHAASTTSSPSRITYAASRSSTRASTKSMSHSWPLSRRKAADRPFAHSSTGTPAHRSTASTVRASGMNPHSMSLSA